MPHCFFCGEDLREGGKSHQFFCLRCRATFLAENDSEGCIVRMQVQGCGAEDCCQSKRQAGTILPE